MRFRPCIDLHDGKVKQIVGSTLSDSTTDTLVTNYESRHSSSWYAQKYKDDNLSGGHVIMLGPGNQQAAREALRTYPGGLQVGGGINAQNARSYLDDGASHVIVTSYVFHDGRLDWNRLEEVVRVTGKEKLVLDVSCRKKDGRYYVVTDRWQKFTSLEVTAENLQTLSKWCAELLVHAVDVEGKQAGIDQYLVGLLGKECPIAVTYAGGISSLEDMDNIYEAGEGRVDATVGSALDIFGGPLSYRDVIDWHRKHSGNR
ncbi:MAG: phosphoribosylformimino-5-aminoimidazole carboxamide ribotide isomerase [Chitinivibrionales bacterium]